MFNGLKYIAVLSLVVLACTCNAGPKKFDFSPKKSSGKIDVSATSISASSNGWVVAEGNVLIRQSDAQVTADRIRVNQETGDIIAEGNVILVREGQGATRTERLAYNYKTGEGITPKLDVQSGVLRIISEHARRFPDGSYNLEDAKITTCTNDESHLHYFLKGHETYFLPEEYVILEDATFNFMNVPLMYFPTARRSLGDHFGWRFVPGYESDWGAYLLSTYKCQLFDFGGKYHDSLDSYTHIDYRTDRGVALGEDLGWHFGNTPSSGHRGMFGVYAIFDDNPMGESYDRDIYHDEAEDTRFRATFDQVSHFTDRDNMFIRTSYLSDSYLLADFYEDEYKSLRQPDSFASYTHTGEGWSGGLSVYHRVNKFYDSINRMPEAWFDVLDTQIGDSPFYYDSQTAGGFLQREYADYDNPSNVVEEAYDTLRIDSRHALYLPSKVFGFLSLVPRGVYRGTYYGTTLGEVEVQDTDGTNVFSRTEYREDGGKLRNIYELGLNTSFKAYGLYEDETGRLRHVVEPYADYTYIPEPNVLPAELYKFDSVDKLDKANNVRFGLRQLLQRKVDEKIVNLIDADVYGIYDLEENSDGDSGLREIGVDSEFRPANTIRVELDGVYNVYASEVDYVDLWMTLWQGDRWEAAGEFYYRPDKCAQFTGAIAFNINEYWGAKIYARYDSEVARLEEISGHIQYNLDCISFRLKGKFEPAFTRDDGTEREAKFKVSFLTWLRAYAPSRYERKLRDGYLE